MYRRQRHGSGVQHYGGDLTHLYHRTIWNTDMRPGDQSYEMKVGLDPEVGG